MGKFLKRNWYLIPLMAIVSFVVFHYRSDAKIRAELEECKTDLIVIGLQNNELVTSIGHQNTEIERWMTTAADFRAEVDRINQIVPERVVEIREVVRTVESEIVSEDCTQAIAEAARVIKGALNE
jgi:hypothetical protein